MTFGNWTVIKRDYHPTSRQHSAFWFCKCEICGNIYSVSRDSLVNGKSECCNKCKGEKIRQKAIERGMTSWQPGDRFGLLKVPGVKEAIVMLNANAIVVILQMFV